MHRAELQKGSHAAGGETGKMRSYESFRGGRQGLTVHADKSEAIS
jgi:hypothetical protein